MLMERYKEELDSHHHIAVAMDHVGVMEPLHHWC
jgi:hypothetical protein